MRDQEAPFEIDELFFSTTDLHGVIQHGNEVFVRISGYTESELLGSPHSIIRHPDMPRCVFQLLWDTIRDGKSIAAYVKNLAKDGSYYWVLALVIPVESGYLSIRLKPTSPLFAAVQEIYARLLQVERIIETEPKRRVAAMAASRDELQKLLVANGFANYEKFMLQALALELASRKRLLAKRTDNRGRSITSSNAELRDVHLHCQSLDEGLGLVFERLEAFRTMNVALADKSTQLRTTAESIRFLSMNASVTANKLGVHAAPLQVVAKSLGVVCDEGRFIMNHLSERMREAIDTLDHLIFDLAATKLQSEVLLQFVLELRQDQASKSQSPELQQSLNILSSAMLKRMQSVFHFLDLAESQMSALSYEIEKLSGNIRVLSFVQFAGEKESASWNNAHSFAMVFQQIRQHIDQTKSECDELRRAISDSCEQVRSLRLSRTSLTPHLDSLQSLQILGTTPSFSRECDSTESLNSARSVQPVAKPAKHV